MNEKECFRCHQVKPLTEFYRHPKMGDGYLNKCKECTRVDVRTNRAKKREQYTTYDRVRNQSEHRQTQRHEHGKLFRSQSPEKYKARQRLGNAIRDGRIKKQPCQFCGDPESEGHHHDYSKPFDVTWACFKCHREKLHGQAVTA